MTIEIEYRTFGSLLKNIVDNRGKTCPVVNEGIPLIATNCIVNNHLYPQYEKVRYVSKDVYESWFRDHPEPGDMIFVLKGTPGRVAWVPNPVSFCIAQDMVAIRADEKKIYPKYLFAILRSKSIQQEIEGLHVGTLIPHFKKGDFDSLLIPVVPPKLQENIGNLYFDLSLKIDLLHRQNKTLEAMAETLFRQWFVEEAREAWAEGTLGDVSVHVRNSVKSCDIEANSKYIGLEHIDRRDIALKKYGSGSDVSSNKYSFEKYDILFGKLRPYFHKVCFVPFSGICSTDILVIRPKDIDWFAFCLFSYFQNDVVEYANLGSGGTRMPRTEWETLKSYRITIPDVETLHRFNHFALLALEKITYNLRQIQTLQKLRDTLLPKLMSGEVRVAL
jgi:type I restriction enzyme S subunit